MPLRRSVPAAHLVMAVLASSGGGVRQLTGLAEAGAAVTWVIVAAVLFLTAGIVVLLARHRKNADATEERLRGAGDDGDPPAS